MEQKQKYIIAGAVIVLALVLAAKFFIFTPSAKNQINSNKTASNKVKKELNIENKATISIDKPDDKKLMDERKAEYGVDKGLDMVIKSNEIASINDKTIDMQKLEESEMIHKGELVSSDLKGEDLKKSQNYGLYVVKSGDNLWDIHFRLLRELFNNNGIKLSIKADQPIKDGYSSGVGKILKFSEKMVRIYSLDSNALYFDINSIEPQGKVVIYKMNEIDSLLKDMTIKEIDNVIFDGKNIWIESKQS